MKLIVFDMDGTLIDTGGMISDIMARTFLAAGLNAPSREAAQSVIGLSLPVALGRLAGTDDMATVTHLTDTYKSKYRENIAAEGGQEPLYPGARDAIARLSARPDTLLGIATGKSLHGVHRILDLHGLSGNFVTLQTPDHNPSKPDPGMLISAMSEAGVGPADTVMVGDTHFDIELGRNAGVYTIGVAWGYHDASELHTAGANVIIDGFDEIDAALDGFWERKAHA